MSKLSKKMYERCLNKDENILRRTPQDVRDHLCNTATKVQKMDACGVWQDVSCATSLNPVFVYRIHPDTPHEDEDMIEFPVYVHGQNRHKFYEVHVPGFTEPECLSYVVSFVRFAGIVYELDGVQTVRTTIDAAFGVPKKVLFMQEDETK
jgi:hypothetical protein